MFSHFLKIVRKAGTIAGLMPSMEDYGIDCMMPAEKEEFIPWYQVYKDLQKELAYYCQQDVKILRRACILFREEIMCLTAKKEEVGLDHFLYITLPSVCMTMYRYMFLKKQTIALLPHDNCHRQTKRYSISAIQ